MPIIRLGPDLSRRSAGTREQPVVPKMRRLGPGANGHRDTSGVLARHSPDLEQAEPPTHTRAQRPHHPHRCPHHRPHSLHRRPHRPHSCPHSRPHRPHSRPHRLHRHPHSCPHRRPPGSTPSARRSERGDGPENNRKWLKSNKI